MKDSEKFDNRDGAPAKPKKPKEEKTDETYGQGVYEAAKLKGGQKKLDTDNDNDIDAKDLAALRAKKKVKEDSHQAKTTMKHVNASNANDKTKAAIGKAAKDIKPGIKGYKDREDALKAAGVEDDRGPVKENAKAAAMWKSMKEDVKLAEAKKKAEKDLPGNQEEIDVDHDGKIEKSDLAALRAGKKETVKESADLTRMKEFLTRLNG